MSFNVTSLIWKRLDVIHNRIMIECMCERELGNTTIAHAKHVDSFAWTANHLAQVMREEKDRSLNAMQRRCPALPA